MPWILVFWRQRYQWNSSGVTSNGGTRCRWGRLQLAIFYHYFAISQKCYKIP